MGGVIRGNLVGRGPELERLRVVLDDLDAGTGGFLAIEGEPGIGKTTLLSELRRQATERGHLVLTGSAEEFERDVPFAVWADALDAYVTATVDDDWDTALLSQLSPVLPSLSGANGAEGVLAEERYRTHRAVRTLLELLAADRPLLVVLDDLHWSDAASDELIAALLRRETTAPVLIGLGYRSGSAPAKVGAAVGGAPATVMRLAPLSEDECSELAGNGIDGETLTAIFREAGGNPFYTLALVRGSGATARLPAEQEWTGVQGVPDGVVAALTEELRSLPSDARALLEAGAVAGDPFDLELAAQIAELETDSSLQALDALLDTSIVQATATPRSFAFRHPLVRRAVYEGSKAGWRLGAHARAARVLAAQGASAAERAHHVEQSAVIGDEAAIALLLEAADGSARQAPAVARRWYRAALRLIPHSDGQGRLQALIGLTGVLRSTGELEECRAGLLEGMELLPPDDVALRVVGTIACAACEDFLGRQDEARSRLEKALAGLADAGSREAVTLTLQLAAGAFFTLEVDRMLDLGQRALAGSRRLDDAVLTADAVSTVALAEALAGRIDAAGASIDEAAALLESVPDEALAERLEAINRVGWAEFYLERYDNALAHLARGLKVARSSRLGVFIPLMEEAQALSAMMRGEREVAAALRENAIEGAGLAASSYITCTALITSATIMSVLGDLDAALHDAEQAYELGRGFDQGFVPRLAAGCFLATALEAGGAGADVETLVAGLGGWDMPGLPAVWKVGYQEAYTRFELAAGRVDSARAGAAHARASADAVPLPAVRAIAGRAEAAVKLADGDAAGATELALEAAVSAELSGALVEAARCRVVAGQALAAAGKRDEAVASLREAEAVLDECGATRARGEARRELRKLGARVEPRGPGAAAESGVDSLSRREREVAELVTARKTNKEIATDLFLSEKTVESHLRNIFAKLGASSRVEVARVVEREQRG